MTSASIDRRLGLSGNTAMKTPVTVVSTSNITLSGEQTIDGVAVKAVNAAGAPDRVLCTGQTTTSQNGIWDVNTGSWTRSRDANGNYDLVNGTQVVVSRGSAAKQIWILTTADPITIGTTSQTWSQNLSAGFLATLAATGGSNLVGFSPTTDYDQSTIGAAMLDEGISVLWYLSEAERDSVRAKDLTADVTTAVQTALTAATGKSIYFPAGKYKVTAGLTVGNRTKILGAGPLNSEIVYRTATTTTNQLFDFDNVDNIHIEDIALTNSASSGGQNTTAVLCQGDGGSVTEIRLRRVYIDGFMNYGVKLGLNALYIVLDECRIMNCTNDVGSGGTGLSNAVGVYFGTTVNAVVLNKCRISANDTAILSDTTAKYSLTISGSSFETNGETGTPVDTINLYNWRAVVFQGNYCEANKTGTSVDDSFLRLQGCSNVLISGNFINGSSGGTGKSKNLIGISDTCIGVVIENNYLEDPITKLVYVLDGNSIPQLRRNLYNFAASELTTYATIMAKMSSPLVELDVAKLEAINTGVVAGAGNYQTNVTVDGVDVTREASVIVTPLNGGGGFVWHGSATANDTVRVTALNANAVNNSFNGTVAIRVLKAGR